MKSSSSQSPGLRDSAWRWWSEAAAGQGAVAASRRFLAAAWEFLRDSTPRRRRQRYGDADYDWQHRVNTTSAALGWRDRLLGVFHSPYQPTEPVLFAEMLAALRTLTSIDFRDFVFVDLGSGKGRALLMASEHPFHRIIGVEILPTLHHIAQENLAKYRSPTQACANLETICADAIEFPLPPEPLLLYLFNPFPEAGLRRVASRLERSLCESPRQVFVLYHNPLLEHVLRESGGLKRIGGTHQYTIYASG
ncbi:MAG TPA: class I SAM-dependent methyltransferase [Candidatus Aquilonibacter sp.]|nr:class I SAM-dependent methyltransferase [Candidatus Aquilonibacter sp.]